MNKDIRNKFINIFYDYLEDTIKAKKLEEIIYNQFKDNFNEYVIQSRRVIYGLFKNIEKLKEYQDVTIIPALNDDLLFGKKIQIETKSVCWSKKIDEEFSDIFITGATCRNKDCGSKKIIDESEQIKSADESTTTFLKCLDCGFKYRLN